MTTVIIGGGSFDKDFLSKLLSTFEEKDLKIIACDRGVLSSLELGVRPDFCIGDFDSVSAETLDKLKEMNLAVKVLNPIKDDTDSEAALTYALGNTTGDIYFVCGTGTRLDHVLGNIALVGKALRCGRKMYLVDSTNRISMIGGKASLTINREKQHGKYISVIPYMGDVKGLTMTGFKYPLKDATISGFTTLTISNEIVEEYGIIEIEEGYLIIMETLD